MEGVEIEALYRRLGPFIYRRCVKILRDPDRARDATQEVFVRVIRHRADIRNEDEAGYLPYIYRIATNCCLIRDGRFEIAAPPVESLAHSAAASQDATAGASAMIARLRGRVDESSMEIAYMAIMDGMTHDEIAAVLNVSRKTVGKKLGRFKEIAQGLFKER